jgi:predicted outer membrane lipoprotein
MCFELTPKALANSSPGFERSENPGLNPKYRFNPEEGSSCGEPFQGLCLCYCLIPGLSLRSNPGLKLANAFGVIHIDPRLKLANAFGVIHIDPRLKLANAFGVIHIDPGLN